MSRSRLHNRRRDRERDPAELNITAFLNLMVILVPFLLITAVFSRMAILELNLPASSKQTETPEQKLRLEVIVRSNGLIVSDGRQRIEDIAKTDGKYDYSALSELMQQLKQQNPDVRQASVLLEPDTQYDVLVHVMDAVRMTEKPPAKPGGEPEHTDLFPEIALGDAP